MLPDFVYSTRPSYEYCALDFKLWVLVDGSHVTDPSHGCQIMNPKFYPVNQASEHQIPDLLLKYRCTFES